MNNFKTDLRFADDEKLHPFWLNIYEQMFPNIAHMTGTVGNMKFQQKGIDRIITLENNRTIYIDEKLRRKVYPDILLEHISVYKNGNNEAKGWMHKQRDIDYLAYGWKPNKTVYLFPWFPLARAWKFYHKKWINEFGTRLAPNGRNGVKDYDTVNVPVPLSVLKNKIVDATKVVATPEINLN